MRSAKFVSGMLMKNKLLSLFVGGLVFYGTLVLTSPGTLAQTTPEQKPEAALELVKSQPVSRAFYDALKSKETPGEPAFDLTRAFFNEQSRGENTFRTGDFEKWCEMDFREGKNQIRVSIYEYESPELASKFFKTNGYSYGFITYSKEFGDEAYKGFGGNGQFVSLRFRKNKFVVGISSKSETTAKFFAEAAMKAIEAK